MSLVFNYPRQIQDIEFNLPCLSGLIRHFALFNLCDMNLTSWGASVSLLLE